jgi:chemotaxis protein histidine kinase CheA
MDAARYAALFLTDAREHLAEVDDALLALEREEARSEAAISRSTPRVLGFAQISPNVGFP